MQACNMLGLILREQALWLTVSLMVAGGGRLAAVQPGYVDSRVCAGCHGEIAGTCARTGMGRSFRAASPGDGATEFDGATFSHEASRETFRMERRDGIPWIRRSQPGPSGTETNVFEERVDYIIGAGDQAVSYLHRTRDNKLTEFPVTWYTENGGHWGISPSYDRPDHPGFSREVNFACLLCHNAYPATTDPLGDSAGETIFPAELPAGIDCQRCHGPGENHVEAASQAKSAGQIRAAIVNPARLPADRQTEVCLQCHLETTSSRLPASVLRPGRDIFSYRPGESLADFILAFERAPGKTDADSFELVSAPVRLAKSICSDANGKPLICTTCHNPHMALTREASVRKTEALCISCHRTRIAALVSSQQHPARQDCVACHMPARKTEDVIHASITDHWISRPHPTTPPVAEINERNNPPYAGVVIPYYPRVLEPNPANELILATAQVDSNPAEALSRLDQFRPGNFARKAPEAAEIAHGYLILAQPQKAITWYRAALAVVPGNRVWLAGLGSAQQAAGRPDLAASTFASVASLAPWETGGLFSLAQSLARQANFSDALRILRDATTRNPESAAAFNDLGSVLLRLAGTQTKTDAQPTLQQAEAALREAVRIQPELPSLRLNLADALIRTGKLPEAQEQLEEAIRIGGRAETAEGAWFLTLLSTGSPEQALKAWRDSFAIQTAAAHINLGTLFASENKPDDAIREYRLAVAGDPQSDLAQFNLGLTLYGRGAKEEALPYLQKAARGSNPGICSAAASFLQKQ